MKYINHIVSCFMAVMAFALVGCDLDENPKSEASESMIFSSESGLKTFSWSFYHVLPDRLSASHMDESCDYGAKSSLSNMDMGQYATTTSSSWGWYALSNLNYFINHNNNTAVSQTVRDNYNGIARLFRAYYYYQKLIVYGAVPWISKSFEDPDDPKLMDPRDSRDTIISHIIDDLDFAASHITTKTVTNGSTLVNRWTALGLKSRVCLFEASWRKYHANDDLDFARTGCSKYTANDLFELAADAAKQVMDGGVYKLYMSSSYANGRGAYRALFTSTNGLTTENMLCIATDPDNALPGDANWWYNSSTKGVQLSMSRKFEKTYLNRNGSPYSDKNADGTYKSFKEETTNRDLRLNQTIRGYDYTRKNTSGNYVNTTPDIGGNNLTGYQFTKYVYDDVSYDNAAKNDNSYPLMRYAEILLNYAEAKAELGTLTDEDWAKTIGALRVRAGITGGTDETGTLTTKPVKAEPYIKAYYPGVTDPAILEVRRERGIELCLEGFRFDDLKRWNMAQLWVDDPWEGIFIPALDQPVDLNGDGTYDAYFYETGTVPDNYKAIGVYVGTDKKNVLNVEKVNGGYLIKYNISGRDWPKRQYLYPIPQVVIQKNPNLTQNPGWENN